MRDIFSWIGGTPLARLTHIEKTLSLKGKLYAKLESRNLTGSVKDRTALSMISDAEKRGLLREGSVIVEPTSGNTGVSLAAIGAAKGYRVILVMPDSMSPERREMMRAYGAELVLTDGARGMSGAVEKAKELSAATPSAFMPSQFTNPSNPLIHERTTGPEIFAATAGKVDVFVAGVGTGGTLTGAGRFLKRVKPSVQLIAVEPASSPVLSGGQKGSHKLQGIGAGFVPDVLDRSLLDGIVCVEDGEAYAMTRLIPKQEGIFVGISSGAALCAAALLASQEEYAGKCIVALFPDSGDRYLSTEGLFSD